MDIHIDNISIQEIDALALVIKARNQKVSFGQSNAPLYIRRKERRVDIGGVFFKATGIIDPAQKKLELTVRVLISLKVVGTLVVLFILGFMFGPKITINGDPNSSLAYTLGFVTVGLFLFSQVCFIFIGLKRDFARKVEKMLNG